MVVVMFGCSNSNDSEIVDPELDSISLTVGINTYKVITDKNEHTAIIGGIERGSEITAVSYVLSKGATISPDPKTLIGQWKKEEQFTITSPNGENIVYTVILSQFTEDTQDVENGVVIAYMPGSDWEFDAKFKDIKWEYLTHVNVSFLYVTEDGELLDYKVKDNLEEIRNTAHKNNVKVLISLISSHNEGFAEAIKNEQTRSKLVDNVIKYVRDNQLDGFDIDYEIYDRRGPDLLAFAKELNKKKDKEMLQTCAVVRFGLDTYTIEWQNYFDLINVMNYSYTGGWGKEGQHSPYDKTVQAMEGWMSELETPASKLVFGLPFFGFSWDDEVPGLDKVRAIRFHQIVSYYSDENVINNDQIGRTYYNGHPTIRKKCIYAKEKGMAGVMIWQIFQDSFEEEYSLLNVIGEVYFPEE